VDHKGLAGLLTAGRGHTVLGGRFSAGGANVQVRAASGPATQVVDLGGHMIPPGFIDTHVHTVFRAGDAHCPRPCARSV
jgi:predicted amidohydrolase YtcJ